MVDVQPVGHPGLVLPLVSHVSAGKPCNLRARMVLHRPDCMSRPVRST